MINSDLQRLLSRYPDDAVITLRSGEDRWGLDDHSLVISVESDALASIEFPDGKVVDHSMANQRG